MDSAMRDLDQLREREDDTRGRKLGMLTLASVVSVSALVAALSLFGRSDAAEAASIDPLTELSLSVPARPSEKNAEEPLSPESLTFPSTLVDDDSVPHEAIVEATVRAAAAEHAALTRGEAANAESLSPLPAGRMATSDHQRLSQLARLDPLVAKALPDKGRKGALAPAGSEGAFTLQVVSYETRAQAESFASTLRSRGHKAFVALADVEGRGRFFRVRVGPFTTRKEAQAYQARFEDEEHMHTIVVSNASH